MQSGLGLKPLCLDHRAEGDSRAQGHMLPSTLKVPTCDLWLRLCAITEGG